ncbi:MAG: DUF1848 domain-containing protein [Oscillospiraceae bacterium]|nr:DUF1848 domain-containing protein [Oscillospiraceae bacterium]
MIIHTGMRTDIPAFYSEWFVNRLKESFVLVRNPFNEASVTRYRLTPDVVDLIGFGTKNPAPMLPHMALLEPFGQYWYVTITPYGREIEPNVPDKAHILESFRRLSQIVGKNRIGWRYDPILLNETYTVSCHIEMFSEMAKALSGYTDNAVISFIDLYEKTRRNFPEVRAVGKQDRLAIGEAFASIAKENGMTLRPCGEGDELARFGADCSGCMTQKMYESALRTRLSIPYHAPARETCACYLGGDIGAYNTCLHLCRYCYANYSAPLVLANHAQHDPASPLLIGDLREGDTIHEAKQESWRDDQLSFDL